MNKFRKNVFYFADSGDGNKKGWFSFLQGDPAKKAQAEEKKKEKQQEKEAKKEEKAQGGAAIAKYMEGIANLFATAYNGIGTNREGTEKGKNDEKYVEHKIQGKHDRNEKMMGKRDPAWWNIGAHAKNFVDWTRINLNIGNDTRHQQEVALKKMNYRVFEVLNTLLKQLEKGNATEAEATAVFATLRAELIGSIDGNPSFKGNKEIRDNLLELFSQYEGLVVSSIQDKKVDFSAVGKELEEMNVSTAAIEAAAKNAVIEARGGLKNTLTAFVGRAAGVGAVALIPVPGLNIAAAGVAGFAQTAFIMNQQKGTQLEKLAVNEGWREKAQTITEAWTIVSGRQTLTADEKKRYGLEASQDKLIGTSEYLDNATQTLKNYIQQRGSSIDKSIYIEYFNKYVEALNKHIAALSFIESNITSGKFVLDATIYTSYKKEQTKIHDQITNLKGFLSREVIGQPAFGNADTLTGVESLLNAKPEDQKYTLKDAENITSQLRPLQLDQQNGIVYFDQSRTAEFIADQDTIKDVLKGVVDSNIAQIKNYTTAKTAELKWSTGDIAKLGVGGLKNMALNYVGGALLLNNWVANEIMKKASSTPIDVIQGIDGATKPYARIVDTMTNRAMQEIGQRLPGADTIVLKPLNAFVQTLHRMNLPFVDIAQDMHNGIANHVKNGLRVDNVSELFKPNVQNSMVTGMKPWGLLDGAISGAGNQSVIASTNPVAGLFQPRMLNITSIAQPIADAVSAFGNQAFASLMVGEAGIWGLSGVARNSRGAERTQNFKVLPNRTPVFSKPLQEKMAAVVPSTPNTPKTEAEFTADERKENAKRLIQTQFALDHLQGQKRQLEEQKQQLEDIIRDQFLQSPPLNQTPEQTQQLNSLNQALNELDTYIQNQQKQKAFFLQKTGVTENKLVEIMAMSKDQVAMKELTLAYVAKHFTNENIKAQEKAWEKAKKELQQLVDSPTSTEQEKIKAQTALNIAAVALQGALESRLASLPKAEQDNLPMNVLTEALLDGVEQGLSGGEQMTILPKIDLTSTSTINIELNKKQILPIKIAENKGFFVFIDGAQLKFSNNQDLSQSEVLPSDATIAISDSKDTITLKYTQSSNDSLKLNIQRKSAESSGDSEQKERTRLADEIIDQVEKGGKLVLKTGTNEVIITKNEDKFNYKWFENGINKFDEPITKENLHATLVGFSLKELNDFNAVEKTPSQEKSVIPVNITIENPTIKGAIASNEKINIQSYISGISLETNESGNIIASRNGNGKVIEKGGEESFIGTMGSNSSIKWNLTIKNIGTDTAGGKVEYEIKLSEDTNPEKEKSTIQPVPEPKVNEGKPIFNDKYRESLDEYITKTMLGNDKSIKDTVDEILSEKKNGNLHNYNKFSEQLVEDFGVDRTLSILDECFVDNSERFQAFKAGIKALEQMYPVSGRENQSSNSEKEKEEGKLTLDVGAESFASKKHENGVNEDAHFELPKGVFGVFDGVSDPEGGHIASQLASEYIQSRAIELNDETLTDEQLKEKAEDILKKSHGYITEKKPKEYKTVDISTTQNLIKILPARNEKFVARAVIVTTGDSPVYKFNQKTREIEVVNLLSWTIMWKLLNQPKYNNLAHTIQNAFLSNNPEKIKNVTESLTKDKDALNLLSVQVRYVLSKRKGKEAEIVLGNFEKAVKENNVSEIVQMARTCINAIYDSAPRTEIIDLEDGEIIVSASDGLGDNMSPEEIAKYLLDNQNETAQKQARGLAEKAKTLADSEALDPWRKGPDDITVQVIIPKVEKVETSKEEETLQVLTNSKLDIPEPQVVLEDAQEDEII